jgi:hypothetical protein
MQRVRHELLFECFCVMAPPAHIFPDHVLGVARETARAGRSGSYQVDPYELNLT